MKKLGKFICKNRVFILLISILLLIPSFIGIYSTKINYDILVYLPQDVETVKGQNILADDFHMGAFSVAIAQNLNSKEILELERQFRTVDGVNKVESIYDITGTSFPLEMLPKDAYEKVKQDDATLMIITFDETTSSSNTLDAVKELRNIASSKVSFGGMSSMVLDTMDLSEEEIVIYVIIAVLLCLLVLMISLDSYLVPILLLLNIGIAILFNMGTNIFLGEISYITKAISAVLQLGVTTDFSIFLYHKYEKAKRYALNKEEAMEEAICETLTSVLGSSLTTIAGFLALCTMSLTLGKDIGIVMAKGVLFGLICVVTIFPALLLQFDKYISKTSHKPFIPKFTKLNNFIIKHYRFIFVIFLLLLVPAWYGNSHTDVYYNLDKSLPDTLESIRSNAKLKEDFNIVSPEILLVDSSLKNHDINSMIDEIKALPGIDFVLSSSSLETHGISDAIFNDEVVSLFQTDKYQMILINSTYDIATDELNSQVVKVSDIAKRYDKSSILAGEGPLMKDLVQISDRDFHHVNYTSLAVILVIMIFVLKSAILPFILILVIEFAIFLNIGIPYYQGITIPFIVSIVLGTIQLGATIDYAILMTTKYLEKRKLGSDKFQAVASAVDNSCQSIFVSGMCFFAATIGVGIYSKLDMISSICTFISRGAIISMLSVILVLPSFLLIFDRYIVKFSMGFKGVIKMNHKKVISVILLSLLMVIPNVNALEKRETVYVKLNSDGSVKNTLVSDQLIFQSDEVVDRTTLDDIVNVNGNESFVKTGDKLVWQTNKKDIFYQGKTNKKLPITTKISYELDGKKMNVSDMLGKAGHVNIVIEYVNNSSIYVNNNGSRRQFYTPFVVGMSTVVSTECNSNIHITNGKVLSNGSHYIVLGIASPYLNKSLDIDDLDTLNQIEISYDTSSFELNGMYSVITPKVVDIDDLNFDSELDLVYSKMGLLQSSSKKLVKGSNQLHEGIKTYYSKFGEYKEATTKFVSATSTLKDKYTAIDDGLTLINDSTSSLMELVNGMNKLSSGVTELASNFDMLAKSTNEINSLMVSTDQVITTHIQNLEKIKEDASDEATKKAIEDEIVYLNNHLNFDKLQGLSLNIAALNQGMQKINESLLVMKEGTTNMDKKIGLLVDSIDQLNRGSKMFKSGLEQLSASGVKLSDYTNQFYQSSKDLMDGVTTLDNGLEVFDEKGISTFTSYVNGDLKNFTSNFNVLNNLSKEYDIYTEKSENTLSDVKFITIIDGEKKEALVKEKSKKVESKSFFQKVVDFFK